MKYISYQAQMVRAIADDLKDRTRRIIHPQPKLERNVHAPVMAPDFWSWSYRNVHYHTNRPAIDRLMEPHCPYGKPGDILGVREAAWLWCEKVRDGKTKKGNPKFRYVPVQHDKPVIYAAGITTKPIERFSPGIPGARFGYRLKIPRYLPGWAVRTTLEILSIRVERLQDISDEDAKAEGVESTEFFAVAQQAVKDGAPFSVWHLAFCGLWASINGPESWAANPFVWVITFKRA